MPPKENALLLAHIRNISSSVQQPFCYEQDRGFVVQPGEVVAVGELTAASYIRDEPSAWALSSALEPSPIELEQDPTTTKPSGPKE